MYVVRNPIPGKYVRSVPPPGHTYSTEAVYTVVYYTKKAIVRPGGGCLIGDSFAWHARQQSSQTTLLRTPPQNGFLKVDMIPPQQQQEECQR